MKRALVLCLWALPICAVAGLLVDLISWFSWPLAFGIMVGLYLKKGETWA